MYLAFVHFLAAAAAAEAFFFSASIFSCSF